MYIAFENCAYNHDVTFVGKPLKRSVKFTIQHIVFGRKTNENAGMKPTERGFKT